jgi:hypothetical protein
VAPSSASDFFRKEFGKRGYYKYRSLCLRNPTGLLIWLKKLNDDLPAHELFFGRRPPTEGDDDG